MLTSDTTGDKPLKVSLTVHVCRSRDEEEKAKKTADALPMPRTVHSPGSRGGSPPIDVNHLFPPSIVVCYPSGGLGNLVLVTAMNCALVSLREGANDAVWSRPRVRKDIRLEGGCGQVQDRPAGASLELSLQLVICISFVSGIDRPWDYASASSKLSTGTSGVDLTGKSERTYYSCSV